MSVRTALPRLIAARAAPASLCRRSFFNIPGFGGSGGGSDNNATQRLTATRVLPYAHKPLYELIADVDSYHRFVPYCSRSRVTAWSDPDPSTGRRWPVRADLHVGWGGFEEAFTSRLSCVPDVSVEAVSGDEQNAASAVFKTLVTRWTVKPISTEAAQSPSTEVHLAITYQFLNPIYAAVSAAVSDKIAGLMIEAFEKQAQERLGSDKPL